MSNPIDATLAAFITQAIREAIAEERRADTPERRCETTRLESRHMNPASRPYVGFQASPSTNGQQTSGFTPFGSRPTNKCRSGMLCSAFQSGSCADKKCETGTRISNPTISNEVGSQFSRNPDTKKVKISAPSKSESRYLFARPDATKSTSNVVVDSKRDIPNKNQEFKFIFQNPGRGLKPNEFGLEAPKSRPAHPNYPPPVYQGTEEAEIPELISDSEEEIVAHKMDAKKNILADPQKEFDEQVPDAITGIRSSLLGVDMTNELECLADELLGTKKETSSNNEKPTTASAHTVIKTTEQVKKEYVSRSMFSDAYRRFVQYLFNELEVSPNIKILIDEYLTNLVKDSMNEINNTASAWDPYYTKIGIPWKEPSTRAVKAIAAELSFSNRLAALEDMIKKMDATELYKFKGFAGQICLV